MLTKYREILSLPGTLKFALAGIIARTPVSMVGISLILAIRALYGSYSLAGAIGAVHVIAFAVSAPFLARLIDRYGQAQVMIPSVTISGIALCAATIGVLNQISPLLLGGLVVIAGATSGSMGALVRSRWAMVLRGNPSDLQSAYAMEAGFDELVFVLGPVVATVLAASVHPAAGLWLALVFQLGGAYAFLAQRSTQPPVMEKKREKHESVMRDPGMIVLAATFISTGAIFGTLNLAVVAFADKVGQPGMAGAVLGVMSVSSLLSAAYYGSRIWRQPLWRLFLVWIVLLSVGMSLFPLATNIWVLSAMMFVSGLALAPVMTNGNTIVQTITPASRLTEGLTWMATAQTAGMSLGSAVSGPTIDAHGPTGGFVVALVFAWTMTTAAVIGIRFLRRSIEAAKKRSDLGPGAPLD